MFKSKLARGIFAIACGLISFNAAAWTWLADHAKVGSIEASYVPDLIGFTIVPAVSASECPSGGLVWTPRGTTLSAQDNNSKAVLAVLMTAMTSDLPVVMYGTGCAAEYIYLAK